MLSLSHSFMNSLTRRGDSRIIFNSVLPFLPFLFFQLLYGPSNMCTGWHPCCAQCCADASESTCRPLFSSNCLHIQVRLRIYQFCSINQSIIRSFDHLFFHCHHRKQVRSVIGELQLINAIRDLVGAANLYVCVCAQFSYLCIHICISTFINIQTHIHTHTYIHT